MYQIVAYYISVLTVISLCEGNVLVTTQGLIEGVPHDGYVSYIGIPYGSNKDRNRRFMTASLAPKWFGLRERQSVQLSCPNSVTEDCLLLDIHTPAGTGVTTWPVMVWVKSGVGDYHSGMLVREGIIVVNVLYRNGPTGFLCLNHEKIPGNAGFKDLVLALRWIRDNIAAFGGSPSRVTVAGQGFGAGLVETLTLSPMADGLFNGIILQSGTILSPLCFNYDSEERAVVFAQNLNYEENEEDDDSLINHLINADIDNLQAEAEELEVSYYPFGICLDGSFKKEERVLTEYPIDLMTNKLIRNGVPIMTGYNTDEAYIMSHNMILAGTLNTMKKDLKVVLPRELLFNNINEVTQILQQLKRRYFNGNMSLAALLGFSRDAFFLNHIYRSAILHARAQGPVYFYRFDHVGDYGVEMDDISKTGAAHSDELAYLFPDKGRRYEGQDGAVQDRLVGLWTNFVKNLNPTPSSSQLKWEPLDPSNPRLLNIGSETTMQDFPHADIMDFWDDVYDKYYFRRQKENRS